MVVVGQGCPGGAIFGEVIDPGVAMFGARLDPVLEDIPGEMLGDIPGVAVLAPGVLVITPGCVPNVPPTTPGEVGAGPSTPGEGCGPTAGAPGDPGVVVCASAAEQAARAAAAIRVLLSIEGLLRASDNLRLPQSACREFGP
jgi:hypothetical protein